jgi:hypothetical protein
MNDKVKITLITTGLLLVFIIGFGLYNTFHPKDFVKQIKENFTQVKDPQGNPIIGIGSKAKTDIRRNSYFFPSKKETKKYVDPDEDLNAQAEPLADDFFEPAVNKKTNISDELPEDYVQIDEQVRDETNLTLDDLKREEEI